MSNVKIPDPNRNFEGHFTTYVFGRCMFLARTQAERRWFYITLTIMKIYVKLFRIIGGWNSSRKVKYIYEAPIFTRSLMQNADWKRQLCV